MTTRPPNRFAVVRRAWPFWEWSIHEYLGTVEGEARYFVARVGHALTQQRAERAARNLTGRRIEL